MAGGGTISLSTHKTPDEEVVEQPHELAHVDVRDAWATNAAAKTLAGAHPGRFVLGLGVSHRPMVEMRGHDYRSPLSTMRGYLKDMREAQFAAAQPEHDPPWLSSM
jgi:alkanesulfonate monooxygenase SsuD/methylene tetrahydromethanopterin reductase-like flavin-dependent oxidoreductase (luciferase family)